MSGKEREGMTRADIQQAIRNFAIELLLYGFLMLIYFFAVLRWLAMPLEELFRNNLIVYALIGLSLMIGQAVALEYVTSFLLDRLPLERFE